MPRSVVVEGVHRVAGPLVNWYLVEGDEGVTALDAGFPADYDALTAALREIGGELRAVVITHAHADHVGFAERARRELGASVFVPEGDTALAHHPLRGKAERVPLLYLREAATRRLYLGSIRAGALRAKITEFSTYSDGEELPVPGRPRAVATPGHTLGHTSLHLPEHDVLVAGDALVTLDPYTGRTGPRLVARAATADSALARRSLDAIAATGARVVLPGHGEPWEGGAEEAARLAREAPQA